MNHPTFYGYAGDCEKARDMASTKTKRHKSAHERFEIRDGSILTVTDPDLDDRLRRHALAAMDQGTSRDEMDATLRCVINHCEAYRTSLFPHSEPPVVFPAEGSPA